MVLPRHMIFYDNGLLNLAAIVSAIIILCGTIPAILLLSTPDEGKNQKG